MGISFGILVLLYILIVIYKKDTIRRANSKGAKRVSKKKREQKRNGTFCYKISYSSPKKHLKRNPVINIMRYLSTYRYECINRLEDKTIYCSCWRDVQDKTGIPRSSLHLILNEKYINKYRHWKILKCNIKKEEKDLIHLT